MKEPKSVDDKTARQLFIAGQIMGALVRKIHGGHRDQSGIDAMLDKLDADVLEAYVDTKPEGFKYMEQCRTIIRMARDRKGSN